MAFLRHFKCNSRPSEIFLTRALLGVLLVIASEYLLKNGAKSFFDWYDMKAWYPLGRPVGQTIFPGLPFTAASLRTLLDFLDLSVPLQTVCVYLTPLSALPAVAVTYAWTADLAGRPAGLLAAAFLSLVPAYVSRSMAGTFDGEAIAVSLLLLTFWLWSRAITRGSILYATLCTLAYFALASTSALYLYALNLISLYAFVMILTNRYSTSLYITFSTFWVLGTVLTLQLPVLGLAVLQTGEHLPALFTFLLLQLYSLRAISIRPALAVSFLVAALSLSGAIPTFSGRFYALVDFTYAKTNLPLIASLAENQPTTWASFFVNLHILLFLFPLGISYCLKDRTEAKLFLALYGATGLYFAGAMTRLLLILAPAMSILSAIPLSNLIIQYSEPLRRQRRPQHSEITTEMSYTWLFGALMMLVFYTMHSTWVNMEVHSVPSIVVQSRSLDGSRVVYDDFREAYRWLGHNTAPTARILAWWDYGYPLSALANRTTLVDNNAWNTTHIALVAKALTGSETVAYEICQQLDVDYVMVLFGGWAGYTGDDINKLIWMLRIAETEVKEQDFISPHGFSTGRDVPAALAESLVYKLSYYRFHEIYSDRLQAGGYDRVRMTEVGQPVTEIEYFEEAFTTEHWLVRIYKVRPPHNRA